MKTKSKIKNTQKPAFTEEFFKAYFLFLSTIKINEVLCFLEGYDDIPKEIMDNELVLLINSSTERLCALKEKILELEYMKDFLESLNDASVKYDSK